MLREDVFTCIVKNTPLISIDFIIENKGKILLGKRVNEPAKGYWFTIGGRIYKNEKISEAQKRILKDELGYLGDFNPEFVGVFEHFYDTGFNGIPTHYVNLAYKVNLDKISLNIPFEQHSEYIWLEADEIMKRKNVHSYVKDYFKGSKYV
ncbi:GDP-mannose mannosyl hydrolase [Nautilia profundicola AmH]|uniref:GDP-mannose mannosyl hydrolase n=1 Tax=Nautilia profundicola (strain ATCC BAA-1463 / DSM 18972 / AmH) TaxID=598659 RepID=B9L6R1_NAUPA|nr:GDP-mannose mannosyl hydrolase [Nautilia profundicola]ACM92938.1 GDP-mannose mannosyl hydrolase [Nautilia profundicola AmH]